MNGLGDGDGEGLIDVDAGGPVRGVVSLRLVGGLGASVANSLGDGSCLGGKASRAGVEVGCSDDSGGALGGLGDCGSSSAVELILGGHRGLGGHNRVARSLGRDIRDWGRFGVVAVLGRRGRSLRSLGRDNIVAGRILHGVVRGLA